MDGFMWGTVVMAIVIVIAGGIAWWLAHGCVVTMIGAAGAVVGGLASLGCLVVVLDPDAALSAAAILTAASGVWLLAWALAGGVRGQRSVRVADAEH